MAKKGSRRQRPRTEPPSAICDNRKDAHTTTSIHQLEISNTIPDDWIRHMLQGPWQSPQYRGNASNTAAVEELQPDITRVIPPTQPIFNSTYWKSSSLLQTTDKLHREIEVPETSQSRDRGWNLGPWLGYLPLICRPPRMERFFDKGMLDDLAPSTRLPAPDIDSAIMSAVRHNINGELDDATLFSLCLRTLSRPLPPRARLPKTSDCLAVVERLDLGDRAEQLSEQYVDWLVLPLPSNFGRRRRIPPGV
ncbi:hypothetical protein B0O80DRAFT_486988 [Mortierella sp. GBAus27b]|nr:hypothetical protein B0O80DRAFT_486988 [Mortierella sp. GBAus27b]